MEVEPQRPSPKPSGDASVGKTGCVPPSCPAEEPSHPISIICGRIYEAVRAEQWQEALMAFEELQTVAGIEDEVDKLPEITRAWGKAVEAAKRIGADAEHVAEMALDFESTFGFRSPYLFALTCLEEDPCALIQSIAEQFGFVSREALDGVLDRCRSMTRSDVQRILTLLKQLQVELHPETSAKLQKLYVFRMKSEDPEAVYEELKSDGLLPTTSHAFNMIFGKANLNKPLMEYYDEMIALGISPQPATYRLLARHKLIGKDDAAMMRRRVAGLTTPEERYLDKLRQYSQGEGNVAAAEALYRRMVLEGMVPDKSVFNHLILCCRSQPEAADGWYRRMLEANVEPGITTYTNLVLVYRDSPAADSADRWVDEMLTKGVAPDTHIFRMLLEHYVPNGQRHKVARLVRLLLERSEPPITVNLYNTIMRAGPFDWSVGCLALMLTDMIQPTSHTRSAMHSQVRDDDISQQMFAEMQLCQWDRQALLRSDLLVTPMRGTTPSFVECLRLMLRELKMDPQMIDARTQAFNREVLKAQSARPKPLL